jgi:hypothetical protein
MFTLLYKRGIGFGKRIKESAVAVAAAKSRSRKSIIIHFGPTFFPARPSFPLICRIAIAIQD